MHCMWMKDYVDESLHFIVLFFYKIKFLLQISIVKNNCNCKFIYSLKIDKFHENHFIRKNIKKFHKILKIWQNLEKFRKICEI